jgi:signal transduction histidine kinase
MRAMAYTRQTGKPFSAQYRVVWPNRDVHWLESRGTPTEADPNVWRGVTIDITERKRAEVALMQTEKLAVAGRLAAAIAHEINNPLEAITNLCYLARNSADEQTAYYIALAEDELRRVAHITTQTLRFHRQQSAACATDVAEVIESIVGLYEAKLWRGKIQIQIDRQPMPKLFCFAGEIRQVMANLVGNALDAMDGGGILRIRLRRTTVWRTGEPAVRVTIGDTGHGIPRETLEHIYEPFFTTKTDVGTGLGLWVSTTLIEKHRGRLWVRSSTNPERHGTVFSVVLPYNGVEVPGATRTDAVPVQS